MTIELWSGGGGHWFVDRDLGHVQVGEAYKEPGGVWHVVVNDEEFLAPELDCAKQIFLENYDRSKVILSPMSAVDGSELDHKGFKVLRLT